MTPQISQRLATHTDVIKAGADAFVKAQADAKAIGADDEEAEVAAKMASREARKAKIAQIADHLAGKAEPVAVARVHPTDEERDVSSARERDALANGLHELPEQPFTDTDDTTDV